MKRFVVLLALLLPLAVLADKSKYYDNKIPEIEDINYMLEEGEYDSVVTAVEIELMDSKVSYVAMEQLNSLRIQALFEMGQYEEVNIFFDEFWIGFPESKDVIKLQQMDIKSYERRRHYLEAVVSTNMLLRLLGGNADEPLRAELVMNADDWINEELSEKELIRGFGIVEKPLKTTIIDRMNREGIPLPVNESVIVKEKWNDRVKKGDRVRGTVAAGFCFPEYKSDTMAVPMEFGISIGADVYWRFLNGLAAGVATGYQRWGFEVEDNVMVNQAQGEKQPEGHHSNAIPLFAVVRCYSPQFWRLKLFVEPGFGGVLYGRNVEFSEAEFYTSAKMDIGLHIGDMVDLRPSYRMLFEDDGTLRSWFAFQFGFTIRRYKM